MGRYDSVNAVYISKDLGNTWKILGLVGRGVQDIKYFDGKLYATTYYIINNTVGLFVSNDKGNTWNKIGPSGVATKVTRDSETIYLGTEHSGLWISKDDGQTWIQKMGKGVDGTKIYSVECSEDITFAATLTKVFKSTDHGDTWTEITDLYNKSIVFFYINRNIIFAGSSYTYGFYLSTDTGKTWNKLQSFGNYAVGNITYFNNRYYVGRQNTQEQTYSVYYTPDLGSTWVDTHLDTPPLDRTLEITWLYSDPSYIFAASLNNGIYRYQIPKDEFSKLPIFDIPWRYENTNELIDRITSYFDHSYPLLGYNYHSEPEDENTSTLNFLGIKNVEPYIYYSSHSGIDFGLKFGTEIYAPASGYATYYYCSACGNTIKINHLNGYQTIYMHLQDIDLATKNDQVWVTKDDIIGRVGMTGNTSGPHLHFEVIKDTNNNNSFLDDFPSGRADPFGWQNFKTNDPWKNYFWSDSLGIHNGTESIYLWKNNNESSSTLLTNDTKEIYLDNKKLTFSNLVENINVKITPYIRPLFNPSSNYPTNTLKYLESTSFLLDVLDQVGNNIYQIDNPVEIEISLSQNQISNLLLDTIKLYFWNELTKIWEPITSIFNSETNKLISSVNHFSWFAVFGEKQDSSPPETQITVSGSQNNGWFTQFPMITLSCYDADNTPIDTIFYSINNGEVWNTYTDPFFIQKEGITNLLFKSQDVYENMEDTNNYIIQVNTLGKNVLKRKIINSSFQIL